MKTPEPRPLTAPVLYRPALTAADLYGARPCVVGGTDDPAAHMLTLTTVVDRIGWADGQLDPGVPIFHGIARRVVAA